MNFGAKERQLLSEKFDTRELLDAVDNLDAMRQFLGDSPFSPPEVRSQLLKLHTMLHEASNLGASSVDAAEAFMLYDEISMTLFQMIDYLEQAEEPLRNFVTSLTKWTNLSLTNETKATFGG